MVVPRTDAVVLASRPEQGCLRRTAGMRSVADNAIAKFPETLTVSSLSREILLTENAGYSIIIGTNVFFAEVFP